jgi:hypothetical protein
MSTFLAKTSAVVHEVCFCCSETAFHCGIMFFTNDCFSSGCQNMQLTLLIFVSVRVPFLDVQVDQVIIQGDSVAASPRHS